MQTRRVFDNVAFAKAQSNEISFIMRKFRSSSVNAVQTNSSSRACFVGLLGSPCNLPFVLFAFVSERNRLDV